MTKALNKVREVKIKRNDRALEVSLAAAADDDDNNSGNDEDDDYSYDSSCNNGLNFYCGFKKKQVEDD